MASAEAIEDRDRRSSPRQTLEGAFLVPRPEVDHTVAQLMRQVAQLSRENRELAAFAHDVSHGLRTPLAVMSGTAEVLCRLLGADLEEDAQAVLAALLNGIKRMDRQIEDLLVGAHADVEQDVAIVDCDELLAEVLDGQPSSDVEIHIGRLGHVPAHPDQLVQVFHKLLHHAGKHRPIDGAPRLSITARGVTGGRIFDIATNGSEVQESNDADGDGVDMDLVYARWAILGHGGRMWVEPTGHGGTVVSFFLPMSDP